MESQNQKSTVKHSNTEKPPPQILQASHLNNSFCKLAGWRILLSIIQAGLSLAKLPNKPLNQTTYIHIARGTKNTQYHKFFN